MSHKLMSGLASAAIGVAVLSGAGTAAAATPATVPAGNSHHGDNVCWNVKFSRDGDDWKVRWTDKDGTHTREASSFNRVLDKFKDECDRVRDNDHHDRDHHDRDRDHDRHDRDHHDRDRDHDRHDRDHDKHDRDHHDRDRDHDRHDRDHDKHDRDHDKGRHDRDHDNDKKHDDHKKDNHH